MPLESVRQGFWYRENGVRYHFSRKKQISQSLGHVEQYRVQPPV